MNVTMLFILRIAHILAGILKVGSTFYYFFFTDPAVKASGAIRAESQRFDHEMHSIERADVSHLTISALAMATARYW